MSRISTQNIRCEAMNRIPSTNCRPECPVASGTSAGGVGAKLAITRAMAMKPDRPGGEDGPGVGERDHHAAESGQDDARALPDHGVQRDRAHHLVARDQAREERLPAGEVQARDQRDGGGDGEHMPHRHHPGAVEGGEEDEETGDDRGGRDQHPAPVHPVGDDPADESDRDGGNRRGGAEEPEIERRAAQLVDEPSLAHDEELEPPHRGGGAQQEAPVRRVTQRSEPRARARGQPVHARSITTSPGRGGIALPGDRIWDVHLRRRFPSVPESIVPDTRTDFARMMPKPMRRGASTVRCLPARACERLPAADAAPAVIPAKAGIHRCTRGGCAGAPDTPVAGVLVVIPPQAGFQ